MHEFLRELNAGQLFGVIGSAILAWVAVMYLIVNGIIRVHAWWTR